jgi:hypothetical protein
MKGSSGGNRLGVDLPTSAGTQGSREDGEAGRVRTKIGGGGGSCVRKLRKSDGGLCSARRYCSTAI